MQAPPGQPLGLEVYLNGMRDALRRVPWYCWVGVYFLLTTAVFTWPLLLRMRNSIVGDYGDNLYFIWLIGWFQKALFTLHQSPLTSDLINFPEGWNLASTEMTPVMVLTGVPFSVLMGPIFGYNASVLASFALTGFILCFWVYRMTGKLMAGIMAGTAFAFSGFRVSHYIAGHLNLLGTQWLVLYFMSLYEALELSPRSRAWVVVGGISLGLISLTSQYYLYMSIVLTVAFVALHALLRGPRFILRKSYAANLLGVLLIAAPIVVLAEVPYLKAAASGQLPIRTVEIASRYSASPTDYLLPSNRNPVLGDWVDYHFDRSLWIETSLYLGIAVSLSALVALLIPGDKVGGKATRFHLLLLAFTSFVLSLGTTLRWFSQEVSLRLPAPLGWLDAGDGSSIHLPGYLLYQFLPYYTSLRVPARYGVYVLLFTSVLAGLGFAYLMTHGSRRRRALVVGALLAVMIIEYLPWRPRFAVVEGREVDYWLGAQPGNDAVVQFPPHDSDSEALIYYTLIHGKPTVNGFDDSGTPLHEEIMSSLSDIPDKASIDLLRSIGVRYVIVDAAWYDEIDALDDLEEAFSILGVDRPMVFEGYRAYTLDP